MAKKGGKKKGNGNGRPDPINTATMGLREALGLVKKEDDKKWAPRKKKIRIPIPGEDGEEKRDFPIFLGPLSYGDCTRIQILLQGTENSDGDIPFSSGVFPAVRAYVAAVVFFDAELTEPVFSGPDDVKSLVVDSALIDFWPEMWEDVRKHRVFDLIDADEEELLAEK